jgi:hypothetical protein
MQNIVSETHLKFYDYIKKILFAQSALRFFPIAIMISGEIWTIY